MTDRELLEMAAKAAGYKKTASSGLPDCADLLVRINGDHAKWWNPLTDDGDALMLAVELGMDISFVKSFNEVWAWPDIPSAIIQSYTVDKIDATRRAIVRAAAEIGRAMP